MTGNKARTYNPNTYVYKTIDYHDIFTYKKRYEMFYGYSTNDKGLIKFANEFTEWVHELRTNDVFKHDYFKKGSHHTNIVELFKKMCKGKYEHFEDIDAIEFEFIEACNNAGLTYCMLNKVKINVMNITDMHLES